VQTTIDVLIISGRVSKRPRAECQCLDYLDTATRLSNLRTGMALKAVVWLLLYKGAADREVDSNGQTPVFFVAERGHEPVVRLLLDKIVTIDKEDSNGRTPLLWAARESHEAVMRPPLDKGAFFN
jgi:hypothetical protein